MSLLIKTRYALESYPALVRVMSEFGVSKYALGRRDDLRILESLTEKLILHRKFTERERRYLELILEKHSLSPWALPLSFFRLPDRMERQFLKALSIECLHRARMEMVKNELPPATSILDLGGGVDIHPEGALLAMGYPHHPKEVVIVDLPDGQRSKESKGNTLVDLVKDGTQVKYVLSDMSNLKQFSDCRFDLVWSGQSIEHVTREKADQIFLEAYRVLKPMGHFCLDTPNRRITKLISKSFLHPDHKFEYEPRQLIRLAEQSGFQVENCLAVTPLPYSRRLRKVTKLEILDAPATASDPECGFSFFLRCRKTQSLL